MHEILANQKGKPEGDHKHHTAFPSLKNVFLCIYLFSLCVYEYLYEIMCTRYTDDAFEGQKRAPEPRVKDGYKP